MMDSGPPVVPLVFLEDRTVAPTCLPVPTPTPPLPGWLHSIRPVGGWPIFGGLYRQRASAALPGRRCVARGDGRPDLAYGGCARAPRTENPALSRSSFPTPVHPTPPPRAIA